MQVDLIWRIPTFLREFEPTQLARQPQIFKQHPDLTNRHLKAGALTIKYRNPEKGLA
jgi:hypothetical protein